MRSHVTGILGLTLVTLFATAVHADGDAVLVKPDTLVDQAGHAVVNGCGPGSLQLTTTDRRFANAHTYKFEVDRGDYQSYTVNFVESCNLHDAGYQGRFWVHLTDGRWVAQPHVLDKILNQYIDYSSTSREWVDKHFLADMQAQCDQQISQQGDPRGRAQALIYCKGVGPEDGLGGWGAETLYTLVRNYGDSAFSNADARRVNDHPLAKQTNGWGEYRDGL